MLKPLLTPRSLCRSGLIAALYAALTLALPSLSYGAWQCRIGEALTLLPLLFPEAVPGLTVGCLVANLLSPVGIPDVVFGTLATLAAAVGTRALRSRRFLAVLCPVLANGIIVGATLSAVYTLPLWLTVLQVAAGEALAVFALGFLMLAALKKAKFSERL